ncbi:MAG TPA: efflux RND transporter permease subunit, partial [Sphingobacteriaceae bacterium]
FIGVTFLGYISYTKLPVELFPNVELPVLIVHVKPTTEVDPKYMEREAIIPLESSISTLEGVAEISSNADSQQGLIIISFQQGVNIKYAYLKLEQKVTSIKSSLTPEFLVNIIKIDTEEFSNTFMDLQVLGSGGIDRVRNITDQYIKDRLSDVDGIGGVEVFGGRQKTVEVIMKDAICEANGLTPNTISNILSQNSNKSAFAGQVEMLGQKVFVNVTAELNDIKNIQNLVVSEKGPLLLSDVADVFFGVKEQTTVSRVNGKDAVSIQVSKDPQANLIELSDRTLAVINDINEDLKAMDVSIVVQSNKAEMMSRNIEEIKNLAITGGLLSIFVLWIFLRRMKLILSIALSIPISVYVAFNFFYAYDISINSLTLIGMALAVGMLVDNSVVVIENIFRHVVNKAGREEAVIRGTSEVMRSVIAATLATVTVFLPFIFSSNFLVTIIGTHIGVSIISTVLVSLVVALVLIPMLADSAIRKGDEQKEPLIKNASIRQRAIQIYMVFLKSCFRRPMFTVVGAIVLFFISIGLGLIISMSAPSEVETTEMNVFVTPSQGSTLQSTNVRVQKIEEKIMEIPVIKEVISQVSEKEAVITVKLVDNFKDIDTISVADVRNRLSGLGKQFEDMEISLEKAPSQNNSNNGGGAGSSAQEDFQRMLGIGTPSERIVIKGQNFELMQTVANDINSIVSGLQGIKNSSVNISPERPEAHMVFDQSRMSANQVTLQNVAIALNDFQPSFSSGSRFVSGGEEYEITIRTQDQVSRAPKEMRDLREMPVTSTTGSTHALSELGNVLYSTGESTITRSNQEKRIQITYSFIDEVLKSESLLEASRLEVDQIVSGVNIPSGIVVEVIHDEGVLGDFTFFILAAIVIIFMILAAVFESLYLPIVIMFTIPLAGIGAILSLVLTGNSMLSTNTLIGFLILLGVVVNNGIILIDYSRILRREGYSKYRALMTSGISRLRPILITAITTIIGVLPLALGDAEYVLSIGQPFAVTVMGGLTFATVLTLFYIPTMSAGLESVIDWFRKLKPAIKATQIILMVLVAAFIALRLEGLLIQMIAYMTAVILIPGGTYFIMTSLRQANAKMVAPGEAMHIEIRNLTKVYGRDKRWIREWKGNLRLFNARGEEPVTVSKVLQDLIWQSAVIGFLVYFIYFHLEKAFWQLFFMIALHALLLSIFNNVKQLTSHSGRLIKVIHILLYWGFPIGSAIFLYADVNIKAFGVILNILWFTGLFLVRVSNKLKENPVDVDGITGRFKKIRKLYYKLLLSIPFVKPKKAEFKA